MSLTSIYYLFYLSLVVILYYGIGHKWRVYLLLAASFGFYIVNQGWYVVFLFSSILVNYLLCVYWIRRQSKTAIYIAIVYNLAVLSFFKYLPSILFGTDIPDGSIWDRLVLPVGISFFSFQAIGYVLDVYWGGRPAHTSFSNFAIYMSFFPQLLSGPVARGKSFMPQIQSRKVLNYDDLVAGCRRIIFGLFKKLVIANNLSPFTNAVFGNVEMHYGFTFVMATVLFAIQVYADFSSYSDIAIGSARLFGFSLIENFQAPFLAGSITEFWRRWHISLSSWVRDYVHLPIQFRTRAWGKMGVITATFATFLIIGIWHGASWSYVIFGLIMSVMITLEVFTANFKLKFLNRLPRIFVGFISSILVFFFMSACFVLLKGIPLEDIGVILSRISFSTRRLYIGSSPTMLSAILGLLVIAYPEMRLGYTTIDEFFSKSNPIIRWSYYIVFVVLIIALGEFNNQAFIYYQY